MTITNSATQLDTATRYFERAVALRDSIREGGVPMFLTANLQQLARYFAVPTTQTVRQVVCQILVNSGLEM